MKKKQIKEKTIKPRNYIILFIIFFVTLGLSIYLLNYYQTVNKYNKTIPILQDVVAQVTYSELDEFLSERDITVLYMCSVENSRCRNFERRFKTYIIDNDLRDEIFYFDISKQDEKTFTNTFYNKYKGDLLIKKIVDYPTIIVFKNNKISDILSSTDKVQINIEQAKTFIEGYFEEK